MSKNVTFSVFGASMTQLIESWVAIYHEDEHIIAIQNPKEHLEYLKAIGLSVYADTFWNSELCILQIDNFDDCKEIMKLLCDNQGLYSQLWSFGDLIMDSIDVYFREIEAKQGDDNEL